MASEITRTAARTSKVRTSVPSNDTREDTSSPSSGREPLQSSPPKRPIVERNAQNGDQPPPPPPRSEKRSPLGQTDRPLPPIKTPEPPKHSLPHSVQPNPAEQAEQSNQTPSATDRSRTSASPQINKKRRTITQFEKIEICKKAKDIYLSHKKIADMFGVERTAVTKIVKESDYWLSLKGEDLSLEGMNRIRRTTEDYKKSKDILEEGPSPHMHQQHHHLFHPQPLPQHPPMGFPHYINQRCDHQVQIARLQDVVGTLQRHHKGTEDPVERIQKVIDSLMQSQ